MNLFSFKTLIVLVLVIMGVMGSFANSGQCANWVHAYQSRVDDYYVETSTIIAEPGHLYFWEKCSTTDEMMNRFPHWKTDGRAYVFMFEREVVWNPLRIRTLSFKVYDYQGNDKNPPQPNAVWMSISPDDEEYIVVNWVRKYKGL